MSEKLIFTNGCFDIIHPGHISLLKYAKSLGGKLIVGLNSDNSIRLNKGPNRPINCVDYRKNILLAIRYVDEVVIFHEKTPFNLIKKIKPDIIVKGGDYTPEEVVGKDIAEIRIFKYVDGYSTTKTIKSITNR
tara:strand:- start:697 stop:1095 length:399 start_codon:yes stop_codon:yes gene_type:complete